jgi:membrane protein DedA with SNARE-associated domain
VEWIDGLHQQLIAVHPATAWLVIVLATFVSEDLTCIAAGLAAASGHLHPAASIGAAALGIWLGDLGLYGLGRWLGRAALEKAPLAWCLTPSAVRQAEHWFQARGAYLLWLVRFVPGTRLPTYVAAGLLRAPFARFALVTALAVLVWAPLLGGGALLLGRKILPWVAQWNSWGLVLVVAALLVWLVLVRTVIAACTWRGRRLLVGRWRRLTQWEYWPAWTVYPPVVLLCLWKALRHRHTTVFTAVNPGIAGGGFVGESKSAILQALRDEEGRVARHCRIPANLEPGERLAICHDFLTQHQLNYPLVLKPDAGQRGSGVSIVRSDKEALAWLRTVQVDALAQEYVAGEEYGVFWYRLPHETKGTVYSITKKVFPRLEGNGRDTLEQLILADPRAVCMAAQYLKVNRDRLTLVPGIGEQIQLVEIGNHCRGTIFLDGTHLRTAAFEQAMDAVSMRFDGFHYGRYDVRATSEAALQEGSDFKIIELNGATSEATHIYDPKYRITYAWRTLWDQWRILFLIAEANRARGTTTVGPIELLRAWRHYNAGATSHPDS